MSSSSNDFAIVVFLFWLTIIFIALKIFSFISWSWWLVLLPAWGPVALVLFIFLVVWLPAKALKGAKAKR